MHCSVASSAQEDHVDQVLQPTVAVVAAAAAAAAGIIIMIIIIVEAVVAVPKVLTRTRLLSQVLTPPSYTHGPSKGSDKTTKARILGQHASTNFLSSAL